MKFIFGLCGLVLFSSLSFAADTPPAVKPIKKEEQKSNPKIPGSLSPPAPLLKFSTPPSTPPVSSGPAKETPAPPPLKMFASNFKPTTTVHRAPFPKVMKRKGSTPSQVVLGTLADMRDLEITILNTRAQYNAAVAAQDSYAIIFERQKYLLNYGSISREEFEQSRLDLDTAAAAILAYDAQVKWYKAVTSRKSIKGMWRPESLPMP